MQDRGQPWYSAELGALRGRLRGWTAYFRFGVSHATFRYLRHFVWQRGIKWLRRKLRWSTWKALCRRYRGGRWWPVLDEVRLFDPTRVKTVRYLYHHPDEPSHRDSPDPVYWVTPRHLAGDDGVPAERIGDTLADLGWRLWPTARETLLYVSPDGLRGTEWVLAANPFKLGGLSVAWQLSARRYANSAMTEWNAYFTTGVPYEALADLLLAIDAREAPNVAFDGAEVVIDALSAQGWVRDVDRPRTTATDSGPSSSLSLEPVPPLVRDADPRPDLFGWQAWAEPAVGAPYLWCASFSASVPHDLVADFASSLASSVPVPRRTLPKSAEGRLMVRRR